ncbi:SMI1/KNR4 family protein [Streptomyces sp. NPDC054861]
MSGKGEVLSEIVSIIGNEFGDEVNWSVVEEFYGVKFPQDYKSFISEFGAGTIEGSIAIMVPIATDDPVVRRVYRIPESIRADPSVNRWKCIEGNPPRLEDVLVWGDTESADFLGWLTDGEDPEDWPLVIFSRAEAAWLMLGGGMSKFLLGILTGKFRECPISDASLMGVGRARFMHDREEERLIEMGIYPWDDE